MNDVTLKTGSNFRTLKEYTTDDTSWIYNNKTTQKH